MTVEELNIKISADAENFKKELAAARDAMTAFGDEARKAGGSVTAAFDGLIETSVSVSGGKGTAVSTDEYSEPAQGGSGSSAVSVGAYSDIIPAQGIPSDVPASAITDGRRYGGTVTVPELDVNETVIGAVSGSDEGGGQTVNITTTVELDGDKVGESVERYNMRRDRMTNGMYR